MNQTNLRETLINVYREYLNDYLTIETFAEHSGLTTGEAQQLITLARQVAAHQHPDA